jgi:hypothetical protein
MSLCGPYGSNYAPLGVGSGGGGGGGSSLGACSIVWFGADSVSPTVTTRYLYPGGSDDLAETTRYSLVSPVSGELSALYVQHNAPAGNGNAIVYTVLINGVATLLSVSLASNVLVGSNVANTVAVAVGDEIDIEVTKAVDVGSSPLDIVAAFKLCTTATGLAVENEGVALPGAYTTLNFIGAGVTATDAGGGVANITIPGGGAGFSDSTLVFGAGSLASSTTTRYLFPGYDDTLGQTSAVQIVAPYTGTLRNLYVRHNVTAGNGNPLVYTVRINGVASALLVSLASTSLQGFNVVNSVAVVAGDRIDIEVTKAASVASSPTDITATIDLQVP